MFLKDVVTVHIAHGCRCAHCWDVFGGWKGSGFFNWRVCNPGGSISRNVIIVVVVSIQGG